MKTIFLKIHSEYEIDHSLNKTWGAGRINYWHREDGPAVIDYDPSDGSILNQWWENDEFVRQEYQK